MVIFESLANILSCVFVCICILYMCIHVHLHVWNVRSCFCLWCMVWITHVHEDKVSFFPFKTKVVIEFFYVSQDREQWILSLTNVKIKFFILHQRQSWAAFHQSRWQVLLKLYFVHRLRIIAYIIHFWNMTLVQYC